MEVTLPSLPRAARRGGSVDQGLDDRLGGRDEVGGSVALQLFFDLVLKGLELVHRRLLPM